MKHSTTLFSFGLLISGVASSPAPSLTNNLLDGDWQSGISGVHTSITDSLQNQNVQDVVNALEGINPVGAPSSPEDFINRLKEANSTHPATLYHYIANLRALNLIDSIESLVQYAQGAGDGESGSQNSNRAPSMNVYSKKLSCDATYTVDESALRAAIHIPSSFTYGKKPPVILFPGTGSTGYLTFSNNFIKLLQGSDLADPVWVNVPGLLLDDAQTNAEYAAYAMNYISTITKQNVTVVGWSQGNINLQWAFKYWPSTRQLATNHIAISPDYAGTVLANFISPAGVPLPPSVLQQRYLGSSDFITTLRDDDGDSAYVPTTTIYSGLFDEIVEPQQGSSASAYLLDVRHVGVTNNEVQSVCPGQPAGSFYTHEGVLYNPLAFALFEDAMKNGGPGRIDRLDTNTLCTQYTTPGLNVGDLLATENVIAIAGLGILLHGKNAQVPPTMAYAKSAPVKNLAVCHPGATSSKTTTTSTGSTTTSTTSSKSTAPITSLVTTTTSTKSSSKMTTSSATVSSPSSKSYSQTKSTSSPSSHSSQYSYSYSPSPYSYSPSPYSYSASSYSYSPSPYSYSYSPSSYIAASTASY